MKLATTLVHKGAMDIAIHAVSSFARNFHQSYHLQIHTDGSPDAGDHALLVAAARDHGMSTEIITPTDRRPLVKERLREYPLTRELLMRGGYFTKLEMPVWIEKPYFYFDSDIVWLRPVANLTPPGNGNAFSTESWSWYYGVCHDSQWIAARTPRRVNSGFYHLSQEFPFQRMEEMLENRMFDPTIPFNTDQEIMAYLFHETVYYHIDDLKRSRVGSLYNLKSETCAALHFPGGMWEAHLDQIEALAAEPLLPVGEVRFSPSVPLTHVELFRMRAFMTLSKSRLLQKPLSIFRHLRKVARMRNASQPM